MLKTQLKKTEKSLTMPIAFLAFFDGVFALLILFVFPGKFQLFHLIFFFSVGGRLSNLYQPSSGSPDHGLLVPKPIHESWYYRKTQEPRLPSKYFPLI